MHLDAGDFVAVALVEALKLGVGVVDDGEARDEVHELLAAELVLLVLLNDVLALIQQLPL